MRISDFTLPSASPANSGRGSAPAVASQDEERMTNNGLDIENWILDIGTVVRRIVFLVTGLIVLGLLTRHALKNYSLEMVHIVVVNAVVQKAPEDYPRGQVYEVFSRCLERAKKQDQDQYMQKLLTLSHRLEKLQYLESTEVDEILRGLECN
jgi:hypothetical protein